MALVLKSKIVHHGEESRAKILKGADLLANAVKVTLGPKGRNVVIGRRMFGHDPMVTKDGVTVANVVNPSDPCEQIGADLVRSAAQKTVDNAGDGTTTAVVLAQAMLHAGFEALKDGASPIAVKRGMDKACEAIVAAVRKMSIPVTGRMLHQVANISSNGDETLAAIVTDAVSRVGKDGVVTVEESRTLETHMEVVTGLQLNAGYLSPFFMTNLQTMKCEYENPMVLLWEGKLSSAKALVPLLKIVNQEARPLLIVGGDFENEAIAVLATNRIKNGLQLCAVTTGAFGDRRREILRDIAAITGANAFTEDLGAKIENVVFGDLGNARKIVADQDKTLIVAGEDSETVQGRIADIRKQVGQSSGVEKAHLEARLAGLTGGVAVIKVGAVTEVEMKEKKARAEDAMYAVKAALDEGIVVGGGYALLWAGNHARIDAGDPGAKIVFKAINAPANQIAANAGISGPADTARLRDDRSGFNALTGRMEMDLIADGVIDPAKVVVEALKNAVSVAGMILTTEAMVAEEITDDGR
jgi:chaperonin GroEL